MPAQGDKSDKKAADEAKVDVKGKQAEVESEGSEDEEDEPATATATATATTEGAAAGPTEKKKKKKKRSKRSKVKEVLTGKSADPEADIQKAISGLTPEQAKELIALNPSLARELESSSGSSNPSADQTAEMLRKLSMQDIMTGLASGGKNVKEMGAYKFWQTQPVPRFGEDEKAFEEGPIRVQTVDEVSKEPAALVPGFEWVTLDLNDDGEVKEVYELLNGHYVEDDDAMFRFNYSPSFLRWAMMSPGWHSRYHVGVRATQSRKLVAYISAIPAHVRVRDRTVLCSEVNFLVVHKKLRGKRLAPVLIKEITRISNLNGIWQGVHTAGIVLPRPVSTCRYFHRAINWQKLYECGFSPLPPGSKPQYQVHKYALPEATATRGLRKMQEEDLDAVMPLFQRYLKRFDMAPEFTKEEMKHWFVPDVPKGGEEVVWSYVVQDKDGKITDFFSFNCIESSVIGNSKHSVVRVAYLWYYASESGLQEPYDRSAHKDRLNSLVHDALILAKNLKFDVFNALSFMDNGLFLEQQKFGAGSGQLHYYLFNYRAHSITGGSIDEAAAIRHRNHVVVGAVHDKDALTAHSVGHILQLLGALGVPLHGDELAQEAGPCEDAGSSALGQLLGLETLEVGVEHAVRDAGSAAGRRVGGGHVFGVRGTQPVVVEQLAGRVGYALLGRLGDEEPGPLDEVLAQGRRVADGRRGAQEGEGGQPPGREAGHLLGYHAAHGDADQVDVAGVAAPADVVDDVEHVARHPARRVPPQRLVASPHAAVIQDQDRVARPVVVAKVARLTLPAGQDAGETADEL
ncbi:glycylpeptide N-tetradecanoyltransferase [Geosmithia morbida]|uniref:Glycylpeptide N-tetradecanoyltransferase n=1 Tax=Geosmithia morbida TaxID=1094350 RepID=A0A9P4Z009_9HYPO|nr:glycylpeptide N-tetradecanoyltransferase [Geosmithia morbida]KAF4124916.1 glycylpeptide N-tetradecanoyltransferase [Geosmithia morbida]